MPHHIDEMVGGQLSEWHKVLPCLKQWKESQWVQSWHGPQTMTRPSKGIVHRVVAVQTPIVPMWLPHGNWKEKANTRTWEPQLWKRKPAWGGPKYNWHKPEKGWPCHYCSIVVRPTESTLCPLGSTVVAEPHHLWPSVARLTAVCTSCWSNVGRFTAMGTNVKVLSMSLEHTTIKSGDVVVAVTWHKSGKHYKKKHPL